MWCKGCEGRGCGTKRVRTEGVAQRVTATGMAAEDGSQGCSAIDNSVHDEGVFAAEATDLSPVLVSVTATW